jgi:RNA polymerase sigma factor (sigma-70 family)
MARKYVSSEEFEKAYGTLYQTVLTEEQRINRKVIDKATSYFKRTLSEEERHACGLEGLWNCLAYYDESRGKKFTTNLWWFVQRRCLSMISSKARRPLDLIKDPNKLLAKEVPEEGLTEFIKNLNEKDRDVLYKYFVERRNHTEIAAIHGISKQASFKRLNRALKHLKSNLV